MCLARQFSNLMIISFSDIFVCLFSKYKRSTVLNLDKIPRIISIFLPEDEKIANSESFRKYCSVFWCFVHFLIFGFNEKFKDEFGHDYVQYEWDSLNNDISSTNKKTISVRGCQRANLIDVRFNCSQVVSTQQTAENYYEKSIKSWNKSIRMYKRNSATHLYE